MQVTHREDVVCGLPLKHAVDCEAVDEAGRAANERRWPDWLRWRKAIVEKTCCAAPRESERTCYWSGVVQVEEVIENMEEVHLWDCPACQGQHQFVV